jgi:REP element-mobilizing transposase RayT
LSKKEIAQVLEQKRIRISNFNLQDGFPWLLLKITPKIDYIQLLWFLKEIQYKVFTRKWVKFGMLGLMPMAI